MLFKSIFIAIIFHSFATLLTIVYSVSLLTLKLAYSDPLSCSVKFLFQDVVIKSIISGLEEMRADKTGQETRTRQDKKSGSDTRYNSYKLLGRCLMPSSHPPPRL